MERKQHDKHLRRHDSVHGSGKAHLIFLIFIWSGSTVNPALRSCGVGAPPFGSKCRTALPLLQSGLCPFTRRCSPDHSPVSWGAAPMNVREVLINTLKRLLSTSRLIVRKSMTYGQLATFKVNTEKSSIGFFSVSLAKGGERV